MMKKVLITSLAILLLLTVGCSKNDNMQQTIRNQAISDSWRQGQGEVTPEMTLRRELMQIQRLENSEQPLSKEQKDKLILIINDIKAQAAIEKAYAECKSEEINSILTNEQKELLSTRQMPQNGERRFNGNLPSGEGRQDTNENSNSVGERRFYGNNGAGQVNLRDFCDQIIQGLN